MNPFTGLHAYMYLTPSGEVLEYYAMCDGLYRVDYVLCPTTEQVRAFELRCAREGVIIHRVLCKDTSGKEFSL